jgi:hypothetical protein
MLVVFSVMLFYVFVLYLTVWTVFIISLYTVKPAKPACNDMNCYTALSGHFDALTVLFVSNVGRCSLECSKATPQLSHCYGKLMTLCDI